MGKEEIIKFTEEVAKNINNIDDWIDEKLFIYKDMSDTLEDIIKPLNTVHTIWTIHKRNKVKMFCKKYANKINSSDIIDEETICKLKTYMEKEKNFEFISNIIDAGVNSKSKLCSGILGFLAGKVLNEYIEFNYVDLTIIEALKIMNDIDIGNFISLYEGVKYNDKINEYGFELIGLTIRKNYYSDFDYLYLTIEKLKSVQVIINGSVKMYCGTSPILNCFTECTDNLYNLIKECKLLDA